eukprot:757906-Hanusia_phi.AAC.5
MSNCLPCHHRNYSAGNRLSPGKVSLGHVDGVRKWQFPPARSFRSPPAALPPSQPALELVEIKPSSSVRVQPLPRLSACPRASMQGDRVDVVDFDIEVVDVAEVGDGGEERVEDACGVLR